MIKKTFFCALFVGMFTVSCRKDRTCECTVTKTGISTSTASILVTIPPLPPIPVVDTSFSTNIIETQIRDKKMTKVTKREAKNNCVSYTEPYNENVVNTVPNFNLTTSNKGVYKYDCKLK